MYAQALINTREMESAMELLHRLKPQISRSRSIPICLIVQLAGAQLKKQQTAVARQSTVNGKSIDCI